MSTIYSDPRQKAHIENLSANAARLGKSAAQLDVEVQELRARVEALEGALAVLVQPLPSAADLDAVAGEQKAKEATGAI